MIRLTFCTKYRSGQGRTSSNTFHEIPQTAIEIDARRACSMLFHYWWEVEAGPDTSPGAESPGTPLGLTGLPPTLAALMHHSWPMLKSCSNNFDSFNPWISGTDIHSVRYLYTLEGAYQFPRWHPAAHG